MASISQILRQKRKPDSNGNSTDTARCIVYIDGKKIYYSLGRYGSPEAEAKYNRLCRKYKIVQPKNRAGIPTSEDLYSKYLQSLPATKNCRDVNFARMAIQYAQERFPPFYLDDFTMLFLGTFRDFLIEIAPETRSTTTEDGKVFISKKPWSRQYVNKIIKCFKRVLVWGINNGMINPVFRESIRLFPCVTLAQNSGLPETEKRESARDCDVIATLPFLTPTVADMVKIQRAACMRPSEVCELLVGDVIFTDSGAYVDKAKNKISRKGVRRQIAFGIAEKNILLKYCNGRNPDEFVFTVRQSMQELFNSQRERRKTPLTPSGKKRDDSRRQKRLERFSESFTTNVYDHVVRRAVLKAMEVNPDIRPWTPYQLRHAAYSAISAQYGVDVASKVAGHLSPNLARVYDHSAAEVAQRVAADRQKGWWQ